MSNTLKFLIGILFFTLVTIIYRLEVNQVKQQQSELNNKLDSLFIKVDSLQSRFNTQEDTLKKVFSKDRKINNYTDLYYSLIAHQIPYPKIFTKISILEKGWSYEFAPYNNVFGFNVPGLKFSTKNEAVKHLKKWVNYSPPLPNESGYQFIKRRGYNPYSFYIPRLKRIKIFDEKRNVVVRNNV